MKNGDVNKEVKELGKSVNEEGNGRSTIKPEEVVEMETKIYSEKKNAYVVVQPNGNLEIFSDMGVAQRIWESESGGEVGPRYFLKFQNDGNLVVYKVVPNEHISIITPSETIDKPIWSTDSFLKKCSDLFIGRVKMQNDGNFVIYDRDGSWLWSSDSTKIKGKLSVPFTSLYQGTGKTNPVACPTSDRLVEQRNRYGPN